MGLRRYRNSVFLIIAHLLMVVIVAHINNHDRLNAQTQNDLTVISEGKTPATEMEKPLKGESNISQTSREDTSPIAGKDSPGFRSENIPVVEKEQLNIKAEDIFDHPEIILKAYQEAYPDLITDVIRVKNDWLVKFADGNQYYWADGKILPESALKNADMYMRYSMDPYNINGRFPELYNEEKIRLLHIKQLPPEKSKVPLCEEGSLYRELFGITSEESARAQLVEVKLFGHRIRVHNTLVEKIKSIDSKIHQLAKTDPEVRNFLNNISSTQSFNWRKIAWINRMSNHSYGIAIDILPKKDYKKPTYWFWEQEKNEDWMLLPQSSLWTPPDQVVKIFLDEKFIWGGYWDRYDTMHFEYRPELIALFKSIKFRQKTQPVLQ